MQCSRCGATVRSGMTECSTCGAPLTQISNGGFSMYRPGGNDSPGYVPGGGASQQPTPEEQPDQPQQRPMGSLQRRLQRSQASVPNDIRDDDDWDEDERPGRRGARKPSDGQSYGQRGQRRMSGDNYGERARRSRPIDEPPARRGSRSGGGQPRDNFNAYDRFDESREEPAYSPRSGYGSDLDESREFPSWDASREEPAYDPPRRHSSSERYRPMDESAEMSAEGPAYPMPRRSTPSNRRSRPIDDQGEGWDEFTNPLEDPRSPLRGAPNRRPSQGASGRRGRPSSGQRPPRRPADDYAGYTDEIGAPGYQNYPGYRDQYEAPRQPGYGERGSSGQGSRGRGSNYPARNAQDDAYTSRESWAGPSSRDAFEDSAELWQPSGGASPARRSANAAPGGKSGAKSGGKATQKRKGSPLKTIISLLAVLVVVAALGVELGPKVYRLVLNRGAGGAAAQQTTVNCATEATPSAQMKVPTGSTAFATTAYALTYPSSWQKNAQSGSAQSQCDVVFLFSQPNGAAKFNVEEAGAFASLSDTQVIEAEAQSAQQQGATFSEITSASKTQSIGGEVWQRREYQATTKSGVKLHLALLATHHKGAGFAIVMLSSDSSFASDDTTTFEPMLLSFQFA